MTGDRIEPLTDDDPLPTDTDVSRWFWTIITAATLTGAACWWALLHWIWP